MSAGRVHDLQRHPPPADSGWSAAMIANAVGEAALVDEPEQPPAPASEAGRGAATADAEVKTKEARPPSAPATARKSDLRSYKPSFTVQQFL